MKRLSNSDVRVEVIDRKAQCVREESSSESSEELCLSEACWGNPWPCGDCLAFLRLKL